MQENFHDIKETKKWQILNGKLKKTKQNDMKTAKTKNSDKMQQIKKKQARRNKTAMLWQWKQRQTGEKKSIQPRRSLICTNNTSFGSGGSNSGISTHTNEP